MKRKVIKLAEKTHVITLPNQWVKKYGIRKSDELEVIEKHNTLIISTGSDLTVPERTTVDISGLEEDYVKSIISVLHKVGYDEIELLFDNPSIMPAVHRRTEQLIGFEVIEQSDKRCVIKNVSGDLNHELDNMIRRTFRVTLSLANQSYEFIRDNKFEQLSELLHLEKTNNRLTNYCHRILNKQGKGPYTVFLYTVIWLLESIADDYRDICILMKDSENAVSKPVLELYERTNAHLQKFYEFFYDQSHEDMGVLRDENAKLKKDLSKRSSLTQGDFAITLRLFDLVQRVYDCFGSTTGRKFLQEHK